MADDSHVHFRCYWGLREATCVSALKRLASPYKRKFNNNGNAQDVFLRFSKVIVNRFDIHLLKKQNKSTMLWVLLLLLLFLFPVDRNREIPSLGSCFQIYSSLFKNQSFKPGDYLLLVQKDNNNNNKTAVCFFPGRNSEHLSEPYPHVCLQPFLPGRPRLLPQSLLLQNVQQSGTGSHTPQTSRWSRCRPLCHPCLPIATRRV